MERASLSRWWSWALLVCVWGGIAIYHFRRPSPADIEDRDQFDIFYDDSRRALQHFTKCLLASDDQKAAEVRHFSAMRSAALPTGFGDDVKVIDMQEIIRSRPPGEPNQSDVLTCQRLAYLGETPQADVDRTISATEAFLRGRR